MVSLFHFYIRWNDMVSQNINLMDQEHNKLTN